MKSKFLYVVALACSGLLFLTPRNFTRTAFAADDAAPAAKAVSDAEDRLEDFDKQIAEARKDYLPTSKRVAGLRSVRSEYYKTVEAILKEGLATRKAELKSLREEMQPSATPLKEKASEVNRLNRLYSIPILLETTRTNASNRPSIAMAALADALRLDPTNEEALDLVSSTRDALTIKNAVGMKFVPVYPGDFLMGSPAGEANRQDNEWQHKVTILEQFYMQTTTVTVAQWKAIMGTTLSEQKDKADWTVRALSGLHGDGDNVAMHYISWDDAIEFCGKLSNKDGRTYRVPTSEEWEYTCRAGTTGAHGVQGSWCSNTPGVGNEVHPVGLLTPNAWGIYDMCGNVWEWCNDTASNDADKRVVRGSCILFDWDKCRSARILYSERESRDYDTGFRVCLDFH